MTSNDMFAASSYSDKSMPSRSPTVISSDARAIACLSCQVASRAFTSFRVNESWGALSGCCGDWSGVCPAMPEYYNSLIAWRQGYNLLITEGISPRHRFAHTPPGKVL
jgi:hypothetical protein